MHEKRKSIITSNSRQKGPMGHAVVRHRVHQVGAGRPTLCHAQGPVDQFGDCGTDAISGNAA